MATKIQVLKEFKIALVGFLDELIVMFPDEGDLIILRIFVNDQIPTENLVLTFCSKLPYVRDAVGKRDDSFFLNNNDVLFENTDQNKINHFRKIWTSSRLDSDDKLVIWQWFDLFITIADKYVKLSLVNV